MEKMMLKPKGNSFNEIINNKSNETEISNMYRLGDVTALVPFKIVAEEDLVPLMYAIDLEVYELPNKLKINEDLEELKIFLQKLRIKPALIYIEDGFFRVVWRNKKINEIISLRTFKNILKIFQDYLNDYRLVKIKIDENFAFQNSIVKEKESCFDEEYTFEINNFNYEGDVITVIDFLEEPFVKARREEDEEDFFYL
ncbi:hypothetical protein ONV75_18695 [Clostridium sp. LQ25]|uniref:hypothetical protein n=1 Tax=Clostridium TaxID=1485 RepID=UPI0005EB32EA|nr:MULTISPECIES: hypothetical protein [Clostridium]APF21496.1 hypothetical protein NPD4_4042 [Clostridium butyricum]QUF85234.1 hypothetical protein KDJ93_19430 [Clostridium butyricum]UZT08632.1 hypothetical protein ONV75_18695 [Clostridium sp. LQ25]